MTNPLITGTSTPEDPQWLGIYNGIIVNTNDPIGAGRVQLQVPQILGNAISNWAVSMQAGLAPPAVGTQVFVQFLGGNINHPYYFLGLTSTVVEAITSNTSNVINPNAFFTGGDITGWSAVGGTVSAFQPNLNTNPPYDFGIELTVGITSVNGGMFVSEINAPFTATPGNNYSVSAWVYYPLGGNVTIGANFNVTGIPAQLNTIVVPAAVWTPIEFSVVAPAGSTLGWPLVGPFQGNPGDLFQAEAVTVVGQIDGGLITTGSIQTSAVNFSASDIGAPGITINLDGSQPLPVNVGDLWFDGANGYLLNQWNGSAWVPYQFGTNAIQAGSITANTIAAGAVVAGTLAAGAIDGFTINAATINGNTISAADFIITQGDGGLFYYTQGGANSIVKTFNSSGTWQAPTGVTSVQVECWGGGGGGSSGNAGGGGGGGEYASNSSVPVTPGNNYTFTVGTGGTGGASDTGTPHAGTNGNTSTFTGDSSTTVTANGGMGAGTGTPGGTGGTGGTGTTHHNGGVGGSGGGGGGSSTFTKSYTATGQHSYRGSDACSGGNQLYTGNAPLEQGGDCPNTYNGNQYTFITFNFGQMVSDFGNATVNSFKIKIHNLHTWYFAGGTMAMGWSSRSSFPSSVSQPTGAAIDLTEWHSNEGATVTSPSLSSTIVNAVQTGSANSLILYKSGGGLTFYQYDAGNPVVTVTYTTGNAGGGGGGASATPTAVGGNGSNGGGTSGGGGGGTTGGSGGNGGTSSATSGGTGGTPGGGGGGGGLNTGNNHGSAGGNGAVGQVKLTYSIGGSANLGGSIAGEAGTDPLSGTSFPEGAQFDNLYVTGGGTTGNLQLKPSDTTNYLPVAVDGNATGWDMGRITQIGVSHTNITTTFTDMMTTYPTLQSGVTYRISGQIRVTLSNYVSNQSCVWQMIAGGGCTFSSGCIQVHELVDTGSTAQNVVSDQWSTFGSSFTGQVSGNGIAPRSFYFDGWILPTHSGQVKFQGKMDGTGIHMNISSGGTFYCVEPMTQ